MYTEEIRGSDLQTQKPETYNCILQFNLNSPTTNVPFLNNIHFPLALSLAYNHKMFEDTKGGNRSRKSRKDRQYNDQPTVKLSSGMCS